MNNYSLYQLITLILMKHLDEMEDEYKGDFIGYRMEEMAIKHNQVKEYQEFNDKYSILIDRIEAMEDKKQRNEMLDELKDLVVERMGESEEFYYMTGLNDARQVFDI
jgi:hypothetical protein